jgi:transcriptional regulator with XRE-family HTH domain
MYVKRRREQRGWTLAELSRQSNIPYGTLRNIEQNERPVKPLEGTVRALAKALEEESPDILFALAGYGIPISQSEEARRHSVDILLESHPEWLHMLQRVQNELPSTEQDQALQVLRVFLNMRNN